MLGGGAGGGWAALPRAAAALGAHHPAGGGAWRSAPVTSTSRPSFTCAIGTSSSASSGSCPGACRAVQPGTVFLSNELPMRHYSDNSLTAAFNWVFAPENRTSRCSLTPSFTPPSAWATPSRPWKRACRSSWITCRRIFRAVPRRRWHFITNPPACARILDPLVERDNYTLPRYLRRSDDAFHHRADSARGDTRSCRAPSLAREEPGELVLLF